MEEGADPTIRDDTGQSAYDIAVFYKQTGVMQRFSKDSPASRFG
jgi:hypothetical protein